MKPQYAKRLPDGWDRFPHFFFALGDTTRQQILLLFDPGEEICVNDIARLFTISRPAISHHLKILRNAGLLACEKRGKEVYYRVDYEHCVRVMGMVRDFIDSTKTSARVDSTVSSLTVTPEFTVDPRTSPSFALKS